MSQFSGEITNYRNEKTARRTSNSRALSVAV
jgi:hypothetical protein